MSSKPYPSEYSGSDITHHFRDFNVLKDGRIHFFTPLHLDKVPPSFYNNGVSIKDIQISTQVSARLFLPSSVQTHHTQKLPVLFYIHGGAFCKHSAFNETFTRIVADLVKEANAIGISVEYRLFPNHPLPACYDDSWTALQWVATHSEGSGSGSDPWIKDYADLGRIFVCGNSAGGNIAHSLLAKVGSDRLPGDAKIEGMVLIQPYFGEDDKLWMFMCPSNEGPQDRRMKPAVEDLVRIGCGRVLVVLAEKDELYGAQRMYVDELSKSGWEGKLEVMECKGRKHAFHVFDHDDVEAVSMRKWIVSFINYKGSQ